MKRLIGILLVMSAGFLTIPHAGAQGVETILAGIWAYGEEVTDSATLNYKQNNLRFFCSPADSIPLDSVTFRFMLKGRDKDWISPFSEGWTFYTDLSAGDYDFMACCRKGNEEWGPIIHHRFTIEAPWWQSIYAYIVYIALITCIIAYILYLTREKIKAHNLLVVTRESQRFRTELVIHAAREFKTPLTIIKSIIDRPVKTADFKLSRNDLRQLKESSNNLTKMVEQLAEFKPIGENITEISSESDSPGITETPINRDSLVLIAVADRQLAGVISGSMSRYTNTRIVNEETLADTTAELKPDAIIIDADNSGANAYSLLKQLKGNKDTNEIPIILISNFGDNRSILKAIRSEADDFLAKPFSSEVLTALTIKNINKYRNRNTGAADSPIFEKRADKLFLERLDKTIAENMSDPEFDVNKLADLLKMNRGRLYQRLKTLKNLTPVEYIREVRLIKAAILLGNKDITVKEVRYAVGMPDTTNFNKRFKERFGTTPTEYR